MIATTAAMTVTSTECVPTKTPLTPASTPFTKVRIAPAPVPGRRGGEGEAGGSGTAVALLSTGNGSLRPGSTLTAPLNTCTLPRA